MAVRFYLAPKETVVINGRSISRPKYVTALGVPYAMQDYGQEPVCVLAADVSTAQHATLAGSPGVTALPVNLDSPVGANLATVQAELEAVNIPSDMVTAVTIYRKVLRGVIAVFSVSAKAPLFSGGVTLDTTLGDLTPTVRGELKNSAESSGYSTEGLTLASTIRESLLKAVITDKNRTMLGVEI